MKLTDKEIAMRVLNGDVPAFRMLVERYQSNAMALAVRLLKDRHEAEEALQDAFLKAYQSLPGFEWRSSFSTWLYRIVFNHCYSLLSRKKGIHFYSIDEETEGGSIELPSLDETPEQQMEQQELRSIVHEELENMSEEYAAVLTLFLIDDLSYEEIVSITGLPLGTVKNRLFRARNQLRIAVHRRYTQEPHEHLENHL